MTVFDYDQDYRAFLKLMSCGAEAITISRLSAKTVPIDKQRGYRSCSMTLPYGVNWKEQVWRCRINKLPFFYSNKMAEAIGKALEHYRVQQQEKSDGNDTTTATRSPLQDQSCPVEAGDRTGEE